MTTPVQAYVVTRCPHCHAYVEIVSINCGIFRHGVNKDFQQIPPHASKEECEQQTVYGCGKPFRILDNMKVEKCDYILHMR